MLNFLKRDDVLTMNIVRGVAVFIMVLSHVIVFMHNDTNAFLEILRYFGDTFAFSLFLFVSGNVHYISKSKNSFEFKKSRLLRIFQILFIYYLLAFIPYIKDGSVGKHFFETIFFINVPNFTEFLIPFLVYDIILFFYPKFLKILTNNVYIFSSVFIICFGLAYIIYPLDLGGFNNIKAIFFGHEGLFRFPVITYLPIFLAGAYFQRRSIEDRKEALIKFFLAFSFIFLVITILDNFSRWPPTPAFVFAGILFALILIAVEKYIKNFFLNYLGRNSLDMVFFHLFALHIIDIFVYKIYNDPVLIFLIFLAVLFISIFLTEALNVFRKRYKIKII